MHILDVGCGPGSISVDLAAFVPQGRVTGIEIGQDILTQARSLAKKRGVTNAQFDEGDVNNLKYADKTFDITHAHQVLQHLPDPVRALREMHRVTKPGGFIACREGEMGNPMYYPDLEGIAATSSLFVKVARSTGSNPDAGRKLLAYALEAGFERTDITVTADTYCFSSPEDKARWGNMWVDRLLHSSLGEKALKGGHATQKELEQYAQDWRNWVSTDDAIWANLNTELLYRVN